MYISILFAITLVFYLGGYTPIGTQLLEVTGNGNNSGILDVASSGEIDNTINPTTEDESQKAVLTTMMLTIGGAVVLLSFLLGFSAIYIIPLLMLFSILNFFVFPMSAVLDPMMPIEIKVILIFFYNTITVMACITFIRGGN
jgi:hypothetical protein